MNKNQYDIISISHFFYPKVGGLENIAYKLLKTLSKSGYNCLAIHGNGSNSHYKLNGFEGLSIKSFAIFGGTYPLFTIKFFIKTYKIIKNNPNAIIFVHDRHLFSSIQALIITKILKRDYIVVSHTTTSNYFNNKIIEFIGAQLDKRLFSKVLKNAKNIIAVSRTNKEYIVYNFKLNPDNIVVINNGFDTDFIKKFKSFRREKIVVFSTKFIPVKDPNTTAQAFLFLAKSYPDWRFLFIGEGHSIFSEIKQLPINIEFIPKFLPQSELFTILSNSAIYINSSINEGLSLGIVEAASLGSIPVLSDAPSNIEVAKKLGTYYLSFGRKDVEDLIFKIEIAMNQFSNDKKYSLNNQIKTNAFNHFSDQKVFKKYLDFIEEYKYNMQFVELKKGKLQISPKLHFNLD